ncbi:MAG: DUF839 domain-containing protein [Betaproteobacteria bacterium]|nr:DUF839 domain-containing protein [Betaproteobacteria bacterium]
MTGRKFDQFGSWNLGQRPALESLKEINHHGVSIVELTLDASGRPTGYDLNSPLNRRVTGQSLTRIAGPAAHLNDIKQFMVTKYDPTGSNARGTLNNCGHGKRGLRHRAIDCGAKGSRVHGQALAGNVRYLMGCSPNHHCDAT